MTDYRHEIDAVIDPDQRELLPNGRMLQLVSVIMTNHPEVDVFSSPWRSPAAVILRPSEARALAGQLLELADQALPIASVPA